MKTIDRTRRSTFFVSVLLASAWALPMACTDSDPDPSGVAPEAGALDVGTSDVRSDRGLVADDASTDVTIQLDSGTDSSTNLDASSDGAAEVGADAAAAARILYVDGANIWVMDADGTNKTNLTNTSGINYGYPAWSPDRTKIAFNSDKDDGSGEIYVMNANGSNIVRLTVDVGESDIEPSWSPDGTKIAFSSRRDHFISSIYALDAVDGANVVRVTNAGSGSDQAPSWSSLNQIAFWTNEGGIGLHIALVDVNPSAPPDGGVDGGVLWGTGRTGFVGNVALGMHPAFSPDGTKIAYGGDGAGARRIVVMNANGTGQTAITASGLPEDQPSWSPDGTKIAFDRNVGGKMEIFTMNANGTGQVSLTPNDAGLGGINPSW